MRGRLFCSRAICFFPAPLMQMRGSPSYGLSSMVLQKNGLQGLLVINYYNADSYMYVILYFLHLPTRCTYHGVLRDMKSNRINKYIVNKKIKNTDYLNKKHYFSFCISLQMYFFKPSILFIAQKYS